MKKVSESYLDEIEEYSREKIELLGLKFKEDVEVNSMMRRFNFISNSKNQTKNLES